MRVSQPSCSLDTRSVGSVLNGADLLLGGTQVGWFGVTIPMVAVPTATYFGLESAAMVSALVLIWGLLHMSTAYFGYDGMEKLSYVAVPFLVIVGLFSIGLAVGDAGGIDGLLAQTGGGEMTFGLAVTIVVGRSSARARRLRTGRASPPTLGSPSGPD